MAVRSRWLAAFGVVLVVHLVLNVADAHPWDSVTKCLLAPLLAAWVLEQHGPRLLALALGFCFLGDLFLELEPEDTWFLVGMLAFAAAHVCFITLFVQRGAAVGLRRRRWVVPAVAVLGAAVVASAWPGLDAGLRGPVVVYALLLAGTGVTSLATDVRAGVGGLLFMVSDAIIVLDVADRWTPAPTGFWIMLLYALAILLLTAGTLDRELRTRAAGPGFDPTIRTDCWPVAPPDLR